MSASSSIGFTAGGIDVAQLVNSLMSVERQPITTLATRQAKVKLQADAVARLRSNLDALKVSASGIVAGGLGKLSSSVSIPGAVTASLSSAARAGSVSFTVDRLARAHGVRTATTVGSSSSVITTANEMAISSTARRIGVGTIQVAAGVTAGKYTVSVTQATVGAVRTGATALAGSTVISGANNTLNLQIDGAARSVTLADGTYTPASLLTAVQTAIDAAGGGVSTSLDSGGRLKLTTAHEGSAATVQVTGGTALATLGLGVDAAAVTGTDGSVQIGTNPPVTVTSAGTGDTVAVATGTGALTLHLDGGLRVGDAVVAVVSTGDRSLAAVASAVNAANVGASAASVKVSEGNWLLQLNAGATGTANALSIDATVFAGVGGVLETSSAQDAKITIGTGAGAYSVTASGNVFTEVLAGVTLTATAESATAVTVSVLRDDAKTADAAEAFVNSANALLAAINLQTKFDTKTKTASPLSGDNTIRRLADEVRAAVTSIVDGVSTNLASSVGITTQRDGTLKFDRGAFLTALSTNPAAVDRLFGRGGSTTNGVTWAAAADSTVAGTYSVDVTTAATRATTGVVLVGGSPAGQLIGVRVGSVTATYAAAAGASAADIVAGLNEALAGAGLTVNAEASGGGVRLTAVGFGSAGSFETNLDVNGAGSWSTSAGSDVVGTIDGQLAIGTGNRLRLLTTNTASGARGLEVEVGEGITGSIGPVDYVPGIAARIVAMATAATADGGSLATTTKNYESRYEAYNQQIDKYEARMVVKEAQLRRQWSAVQTLLSNLQTQQDWLAGQIGSLSPSQR